MKDFSMTSYGSSRVLIVLGLGSDFIFGSAYRRCASFSQRSRCRTLPGCVVLQVLPYGI